MKKLLPEQIEEIIKLYNQGVAPIQIAKQFSIYNNSVTRIIRKHGLARNQLVRVSQAKIDQIIKDYAAGVSSEIIGKKLNINGSTVCRILRRNNIVIRPDTQNKRKYKIVQDYFEKIDTEEKAYFLGFMYADGNLSRGSGIKICLQAEDRDILEKFSNIIYGFVKLRSSTGELQDGTPREYLTFAIYCEPMHRDLTKLGCPPAKTFDIRFPTEDIVPSHLLRHFVRGYFDGDGCINIEKPVVDFSSNAIFADGIKEYLTSNNIRCGKIILNKENILSGSTQLTGVDNVIDFYHFIYDGATIFMQRKYNTFQKLFVVLENAKNNRNIKHFDISKYGTTYIPQYNGELLTTEVLGKLSNTDKESIANILFDFYRENGFPYGNLTDDEILKDFNVLKNLKPLSIEKNNKTLITYHQSGIPIFKHFSPHFFDVNSGSSNDRLSMSATFHNDDSFRKVIKNRLDGNFNMTGNMIKQGLANSKIAYKASIFNPMVAKYIYEKYTQPNDIIYDYSMGFGQRLLAALSLSYPINYVGVDPMLKTVESNRAIFDFFNKNVPMFNKQVDLNCIGSELYCNPKYIDQVSLAFSSPPYFNAEIYEDNSKQAYHNGSYIDFINIWWRQTMKNIVQLLKSNGIFAINVAEQVDGFNIAEDMCNVAREQGLILIDTYQMQISRNTKFNTKDGKIKYEPIYIFQNLGT